VFAPNEGVQFLLSRTGRADTQGAARLAHDLGYLPLALDHAAAFCVETGDSFAEYAERLPQWIAHAPESADYPRAVAGTFSAALEQAAAKCPEAEKLMGILAWLAPDDIPRDLFTEDVMEGIALRRATAALKNVSLLTIKEQAKGGPLLSVHRLVQMVVRDRLAREGQAEDAAALALTLVADAFPGGDSDKDPLDVRSWPVCAALRAHALSVLQTAPETGTVAEKTSRLLNHLALYLNARAEHLEAEPLMRRALAIDEKAYGPDHPDVARDLNNLAQLLQDTNGLAEVEPLYRRALAILMAGLGPDHPSTRTVGRNHRLLLEEIDARKA